MNTLWNKIWADLWLFKARTIPAIVSIAVGVFCVGTLFGMIDLQLDKMDAAHRQSQPADINLILRQDTSTLLLERIKTVTHVSGLDTLTQLTIRFKRPDASEWSMGTLIVRPETLAQKFDKTNLESGIWPAKDKVAIERMSAQFNGMKIGDKIEFETAKGTKSLEISGVVRHPFVKPPSFGGQVHFFIDPSNAGLFGIPANTFRQLLVQTTQPYLAEKSRLAAHKIRTLLNTSNVDVNATLLQNPEKHWGRQFLAGVNVVLQIMALTSLVLASVLILNTLSSHITQQTDQIGIMKSLGAKTVTIATMYLYEALLMALAAIILGLPLSLGAAYVSSCKLLDLFNIDGGSFDYSSRAVQYMLLGGLFTPLLAALGPVLRGASMPVREACSSYGLGADFGSNRFDLWVERIGAKFLPTLYAAALGNVFRRKSRLLLTQSVLIIAGVMFMVLMSLIASVNLTLDNEIARSQYAVRLGFSDDQSESKVIELVKSVSTTEKMEFWLRLPMEMSKNQIPLRQKGSLGVQLISVPASTVMYRPFIEKGRWLKADDAGQRVIVLSVDTARLNDLKIGDSINILTDSVSNDWHVIGLYRWLAGSNYTVEPVYAPLETVRNMTKRYDVASFALFGGSIITLAEEDGFMRALKQIFQANDIKLDVYTTLAKLEQRQFSVNQFKPIIATLLGLAFMISVVGGVGLSGTLVIGVLQRTREIGILFAIGGQSRAVFRLFLLEGLLHGILAWSLSIPLAYLAAEPIAKLLGKTMLGIQLDFVYNLSTIFYWLGILIVIAWVASFWPARKAAQLTVGECLDH